MAARVMSIGVISQNVADTQVGGACTVPGVQAGHTLTITISDNSNNDVTSNYTITGLTLNENGEWTATISPPILTGSGYTIQVSCSHDQTTTTAQVVV